MTSIHPAEVGDNHILIDVRTPAEFKAERIPSSINIPLDRLERETASLQGRDNLVLVCASGARAKKATQILSEQGHECAVLEDGIKGWKTCERALETSKTGIISLERQVRIVAGGLVAIASILALFVHPYWAALSGFVGCGLVFAGVTDTCGMALMLAKLPFNQR